MNDIHSPTAFIYHVISMTVCIEVQSDFIGFHVGLKIYKIGTNCLQTIPCPMEPDLI